MANRMLAFGLLPGGLYLVLEKFVLRGNTAVMGSRYTAKNSAYLATWITDYAYCSVWVFLLLASEAMKTHKANPNFR